MHVASLGEFEQGRPVLESLKLQFPEIQCVISFFSPSGYEVMKRFDGADVICYLPTDTPANAIRFIKLINPTLVLWVKYDYWYHHLRALKKRNIPVLLISGIFREEQAFFRWYGSIHKKMLCYFNHFFVQNESAANLLEPLLSNNGQEQGMGKITIGGDTRFDRVIDIAENWEPVPPIEKWIYGTEKILVAGSTWPEDEEELVHFVRANKDVRLILAPHQVEPDLLKDTIALFEGAILFSDLLNNTIQPPFKSNVLIINNVGLLSRIYNYAKVSYVGGGFTGSGIHNVLEAAVYGRPVVHGPEYEKYAEAVELVNIGGSFPVENALELESRLGSLFSDDALYHSAAHAAKRFVYKHQGGTQKIIDYIQANRLLTSL